MFGLKMGELLIILLVVLVLFGGTKLPQLGSSLGAAIRNFKRGFGTDDAPAAEPSGRSDSLGTGPTESKTTPRAPAGIGKDV